MIDAAGKIHSHINDDEDRGRLFCHLARLAAFCKADRVHQTPDSKIVDSQRRDNDLSGGGVMVWCGRRREGGILMYHHCHFFGIEGGRELHASGRWYNLVEGKCAVKY